MANMITIQQGNCFDLINTLHNESVDCVLTDPPYFIHGFESEWTHSTMKAKVEKNGVVTHMPKGMKFDPRQGLALEKYIFKVSNLLYTKIKKGGFYLCFSASRLQHRMATGIENAGFEIRDVLIWKRTSQPKAMRLNHFIDISKTLTNEEKETLKEELKDKRTPQLTVMYEAIILAQRPKGKATFIDTWKQYQKGLINVEEMIAGNFIDVLEVPRDKNKINHMTPKPLALIKKLIDIFTNEGDVVLDPFLGSGTTAVACKHKNRRCIGYEVDSEHFALCLERIKNGS